MKKNITFILLIVATISTTILNLQISLGDSLSSSSVSLNNIEALATVEVQQVMVRRTCLNGTDVAKLCETDVTSTEEEVCDPEKEEYCKEGFPLGTGGGQTDYCKENGCEYETRGVGYKVCIRCGAYKYEEDQHIHKWKYNGMNSKNQYVWICRTCYSYGYSSNPGIEPYQ